MAFSDQTASADLAAADSMLGLCEERFEGQVARVRALGKHLCFVTMQNVRAMDRRSSVAAIGSLEVVVLSDLVQAPVFRRFKGPHADIEPGYWLALQCGPDDTKAAGPGQPSRNRHGILIMRCLQLLSALPDTSAKTTSCEGASGNTLINTHSHDAAVPVDTCSGGAEATFCGDNCSAESASIADTGRGGVAWAPRKRNKVGVTPVVPMPYPSGGRPPLCRDWLRGRNCTHPLAHGGNGKNQGKDGCPFRHEFANLNEERQARAAEAERQCRLAQDRAERDAQAAAHGDPHGAGGKLAKSLSDRTFVEWLIETFGGLAALRAGTGVIDVAGGRGAIAYELHCQRGVQCTMIDPRPLRLRSWQRRAIRRRARKLYGTESAAEVQTADMGCVYDRIAGQGQVESATKAKGARKSESESENGREDACESDGESKGGVKGTLACMPCEASRDPGDTDPETEWLEAANKVLWCKQGAAAVPTLPRNADEKTPSSQKFVRVRDGDDSGVCYNPQFQHLQEWFGTELLKSPQSGGILRNCSLLIGMHPDQATEAIIDAALQLGKPFAVVPCCVYPTLFPLRRLPNGKPVVSYEDFIQYLLAKDGSIQSQYLNFRGRNQVLFRTGAEHPKKMNGPMVS
eukprot:g376.t1